MSGLGGKQDTSPPEESFNEALLKLSLGF
jgi:hypothetical protein